MNPGTASRLAGLSLSHGCQGGWKRARASHTAVSLLRRLGVPLGVGTAPLRPPASRRRFLPTHAWSGGMVCLLALIRTTRLSGFCPLLGLFCTIREHSGARSERSAIPGIGSRRLPTCAPRGFAEPAHHPCGGDTAALPGRPDLLLYAQRRRIHTPRRQ